MKKLYSRVISLLLIAVMLLTACGSTQDQKETTDAADSTSSAEASVSGEETEIQVFIAAS